MDIRNYFKSVVVSFSALALVVTPVAAAPERVPASVVNPHSQAVATVVIPPHAVELAPHVFSLGTARDIDGTIVEGYAFVHPRDEAVRPGSGGPARPGKSTCYALLANGARWQTTEPYLFNPVNADNLSAVVVEDALTASVEAWDTQVSFDVFGSGSATSGILTAETSAPDGLNEVYFGDIADSGTIAVTTVWGVFSGPTFNRRLVEWDMVFDDTDYLWGDATSVPTVMDFQNIATHEVGHAVGLGHPADSCADETMYRFASNGETKKRDLYTGDIAGIRKLYQ